MDILIRIGVLVGGIIAGICMIRYTYALTRFFGYNSVAERYLGGGGTYTMWRILGFLAIIFSVWFAFR